MKKKLILHIGLDKTGTSTIQNVLHVNRDYLLNNYKILYPLTGQWHDHSHHRIPFSMIKNNLHSNEDDLSTLLDSLLNEIATSTCERVVISSEIFRSCINLESFDLFYSSLVELFESVDIVIYLRNQVNWLLSLYNQFVKDNNVRFSQSFNNFFEKTKERADYFTLLTSIEMKLKRLDKKNVNFKVFKYVEKSNQILDDFFEYLEVDIKELVINNTNMNKSLNRIELDMYRHFNRFDISDEIRNFLRNSITEVFGTDNYKNFNCISGRYALVDNIKKDEIYNYYRESNKKINLFYFNDENDLFDATLDNVEVEDYSSLNIENFSKLLIKIVQKNLKETK